ncbi:InlB B-repeat-containing protein [Eubacterium sp.]|uniref:InlB B-repeat-containing protein n=1 Tax=Eubacterium sp. TaxID=142586 RepID=UPI003EFC61D8
MRCKNCGSENEDNLYICQNCGSPLYDEDDNDALAEDEMGKTKVVPTVAGSSRGGAQPPHTNRTNAEKDEKQKQKEKTIAVIVILAVVLAVVVGVLAAVLISNSKDKNDVEGTSLPIVTTTEAPSTTAPTTTQTTTETTTESTTESTTVVEYTVTVSCSQGGEVEGDGVYAKGEKCTVIARADDGFAFDGWYKNGKRVSSNEVYSFSVNSDTDLEAVFTDYSDVTDYEYEE